MKIYLRYNASKDKEDVDILCRAYPNQRKDCEEVEQCAGDICFKERICADDVLDQLNVQATAFIPRGIAVYMAGELWKLKKTNYKIGISNEYPDIIGSLTSCKDNFDISIESALHLEGLYLSCVQKK